MLRELCETGNPFTLPISGTGSAGMEAAVANLVEEGDPCVIGVNGVFGGRIAELVRRHGGEPLLVEVPFGEAIPQERLIEVARDRQARLLAVVHAETSTGVLQPIDRLASGLEGLDCLLLVDAVTSLGGVPVRVDAWGIDALYSGTQKCLSAPPGLAPLTVSDRAFRRVRSRRAPPHSWYLDLQLLAGYWDEGGARAYHHTAPVAAIRSLAEALRVLQEEPAAERHERHLRTARHLWAGLAELGFELLVEESVRTPMLTSVLVPDGVDEAALRRSLLADHGIEVGGGLGPLKGRVFRVGLMGHGAREANVDRLLEALASFLRSR